MILGPDMSLKEVCEKKLNRALLRFSFCFFILSLSLASLIYLKRYETLLSLELEKLTKEERRLSGMVIKLKNYRLFPLFKEEDQFETFLKAMDTLKTHVDNILLNTKVQKEAIWFEINVNGECSSRKLFYILDFIEDSVWPPYIIKSIELKNGTKGVAYNLLMETVLVSK